VDRSSITTATRRQLLRGAIVAGTAAGASSLLHATPALADEHADAAIVQRLIDVEQLVAFAYEWVLRTRVLSAAVVPTVSLFLDQERQHVAVWDADLRGLGGGSPRPPTGVTAADDQLAALHVTRRLTELKSQRDAIELLVGAEAAIIGAYYVAISKLADSALLQAAAEAMAAEAQHATALRRVLHPRVAAQFVPNAFVEGSH
jgi:ferritin-like protein